MKLVYNTRAYEVWAPVIARWAFAFLFLMGALFKVMAYQMEVAQTAAAGVPLASLAVILAFILELVAGIALVIGYRVRLVGFVLALYVFLLALIFYHNLSDMMTMGQFFSHMAFVAGLLYVSVYGAQHVAVKKDMLPMA